MQKVRGFVHFEGKDYDSLKTEFSNFELNSVRFSFFKSLYMNEHEISEPGVFFSGKVNDNYSSSEIVGIFRKHTGLQERLERCDVSIESEDKMKQLEKGELIGNYLGLRINPPYESGKVYDIALKLGVSMNASDVYVRTVEPEDNGTVICIDLITKANHNEARKKFEDLLYSEGLNVGGYIFIKLE